MKALFGKLINKFNDNQTNSSQNQKIIKNQNSGENILNTSTNFSIKN